MYTLLEYARYLAENEGAIGCWGCFLSEARSSIDSNLEADRGTRHLEEFVLSSTSP